MTGLDAEEHRGPPPPAQAPPQPGTRPDESTLPSTPAQAEGTASPPPGGGPGQSSQQLCAAPPPCPLPRACSRRHREVEGRRQRGEGGEGREEVGGREQEEQEDGELPKSGLSCSTSQVVSSLSRWEVSLFKPPPPSYSLLLEGVVVVALVSAEPLAASIWLLTPTACTMAGALACSPHAERPVS